MKKILPIYDQVKHNQKDEENALNLLSFYLDNINQHNSQLNALISVKSLDTAIAELKTTNKNGALYGIPFVLKDSYVTTDMPTTAGSKVLGEYYSPYESTVSQKLKDEGAILIGKANLDAWGHGASTENSDWGAGHNPWDIRRVQGGSSGGAAAAVSSQLAAFAIGEDTGGSIRNPSAWNNVSGLKVTYGRVSRYGSIAYASSLDTVGPIARTVEDLAYILNTIAGVDPQDASSSYAPVPDYFAKSAQPTSPLRIGIPRDLISTGLDPEIKNTIDESIQKLASLGHKTLDIDLNFGELSLAAYYTLAPSETSSNLARYDGVRYGGTRDQFTNETARRILIGTYDLSSGYYDAYYRRAQQARTHIIKEFEKIFLNCDVIALPTTPTMPPEIGSLINDPLANMLADLYTTPVSLAGLPALAVPAGFSQSALPIGLQLVAPKFAELRLLQLGREYQKITNWHERMPPILGVER